MSKKAPDIIDKSFGGGDDTDAHTAFAGEVPWRGSHEDRARARPVLEKEKEHKAPKKKPELRLAPARAPTRRGMHDDEDGASALPVTRRSRTRGEPDPGIQSRPSGSRASGSRSADPRVGAIAVAGIGAASSQPADLESGISSLSSGLDTADVGTVTAEAVTRDTLADEIREQLRSEFREELQAQIRGTAVAAEVVTMPPPREDIPPPSEPKPPFWTRKRLLIVAAVLLIAAIAGVVGALFATSGGGGGDDAAKDGFDQPATPTVSSPVPTIAPPSVPTPLPLGTFDPVPPTFAPVTGPTPFPVDLPTDQPVEVPPPTLNPTTAPPEPPTFRPTTLAPTLNPTARPTTQAPTRLPTSSPTSTGDPVVVEMETLNGRSGGDRFGDFVMLSRDGSTLVVGAQRTSYVRVFRRNGDTWDRIGQTIEGEREGDVFGRCVDVSADGSVIVVGARNNDNDGGADAGHARVYRYNGSRWNQIGQDLEGRNANDRFGWYVKISDDGSTVAVSSTLGDPSGRNDAGYVRVYRESGDRWEQLGDDLEGGSPGIQFGRSLGMSSDGRRLAVGAQEDASLRGRIRVFDYISGDWTQIGQSLDGLNEEDWQGTSCTLSGDGTTVAVGADGADANGSLSGMVRVYRLDGNRWTQRGQNLLGEAAGDQFGANHVSLSTNGEFLVVGASHNDNDRGEAYLFQYSGSSWKQLAEVSGDSRGDGFGDSVTISGNAGLIAVGGPDNGAGYVRVWEVR